MKRQLKVATNHQLPATKVETNCVELPPNVRERIVDILARMVIKDLEVNQQPEQDRKPAA